MPPVLKMATPQ